MKKTTASPSMLNDPAKSSLALLQEQRSHVLFVLSDAIVTHESDFLNWYQGEYWRSVSTLSGVLRAQHYVRHEVDITQGRHVPLPYRYLALYDLALNGAETAEYVIERIVTLHSEQVAAQVPATWLYYPASEKVGRSPRELPSMLTIAFANGFVGQEADFREWYATRHIRDAMNVTAIVSGQCFERTHFQRPGAFEANFNTIALYEQEGTPESIIESLNTLPESVLRFPALDLTPPRFAELVYRPLPSV